MATQAQISDWITKVRQFETKALDMFSEYQRLQFEAALTGRVVVDEQGAVTTNLTADNFQGENAGLNIDDLIQAFAALGVAFAAVSNEVTAKMFETKA